MVLTAARTGIVILSQARRALAEAVTLPEITTLIDQAEVVRVAARMAGLSTEAQNDWTRYKIDCQRAAAVAIARLRAAGELARQGQNVSTSEARKSLADLGVKNAQRASEWASIATIPEECLEAEFTQANQAGRQVAESALLQLARILNRPPERPQPPLPAGVFDLLYADPPWQYEHVATESRAIENHYRTRTVEELCAFQVPAAADAVLYLWAPNPKLEEALQVMRAWDFGYRTNMVWVKDKIGMGYYVRQRHELLLIGRKGNFPVPEPGDRPDSVITAQRGGHSEKPDVVFDLLERMYPNAQRVQLFGRKEREGWVSWGDELE